MIPANRTSSCGFTLIELLVSLLLATLILVATTGLLNNTFGTEDVVSERNQLQSDIRFAMQRMVIAVSTTPRLMLPTNDKPDTDWRENVREETVPASPPEGSSSKATAILAVCLGTAIDLDGDGFADADNDRDGRIDEDLPGDITNDSEPGIRDIDDGGNGQVDEGFFADRDDDERLNASDEDPVNGVDDDNDGLTDEDSGSDMNADGAPGLAGVDDDGDGQVDEGSNSDDDEDGSNDEDWIDVVAFYLQGNTLIERHAVPWDETANGSVDGRDYIESVIAENVTRFRVERVASGLTGPQLVELTLESTGPDGSLVSMTRRVRVGAAQ
ncbi:MAG: prepilin-type N-terminal cleavage/methylation domain-containing protein [Gammaproteobacteria bacterium]|nr:prepilin-type N-terminal cleavage/methylation domain-containing protein [Gammaproteobacteria bacterium]